MVRGRRDGPGSLRKGKKEGGGDGDPLIPCLRGGVTDSFHDRVNEVVFGRRGELVCVVEEGEGRKEGSDGSRGVTSIEKVCEESGDLGGCRGARSTVQMGEKFFYFYFVAFSCTFG